MSLAYDCHGGNANKFFIANDVHPTTVAVVKNRALPLEYEIVEGDPHHFDFDDTNYFGALLQYVFILYVVLVRLTVIFRYPGTDGFVDRNLEGEL